MEHYEYTEFRFGELRFANAPPPAGVRCVDHAAEHSSVTFACGHGLVIRDFSFASFGTPAGNCATPSTLAKSETCDAKVTLDVLNAACVGKDSCVVPVPTCAGGTCSAPWNVSDPCHGAHKWLTASASCEALPTTPPAPTPPGPTVVALEDIVLSAWVVRLPSDGREAGSASLYLTSAPAPGARRPLVPLITRAIPGWRLHSPG